MSSNLSSKNAVLTARRFKMPGWQELLALFNLSDSAGTSEEDLRKQADWFLLLVNFGAFVFATLVGMIYQQESSAWLYGAPLFLIALVLNLVRAGGAHNAHVHGTLLAMMAALHVHLARGMIEYHFGFFIFLAVMLIYRRAIVLWSMSGVILILHLVMDYLQQAGFECYIFRGTLFGLNAVLLHGFYVAVCATILSLLAAMLRRHAENALETAKLLERLDHGKGVDFLERAKPDSSGRVSRFGRMFNDYADNMTFIVAAFRMLRDDVNELRDISKSLGETNNLQMKEGSRAAEDLRKFVQELSSQAEQMKGCTSQTIQMKDDCFDLINEINQANEQLSRMAKQTFEANREIQALTSEVTAGGESASASLGGANLNKLMVAAASLDHLVERMQTFVSKMELIKRGLSAVEDQTVQMDRMAHQATEEAHSNQRLGWELLGSIEQMQASTEDAFKTLRDTVGTIVRASKVVSEMENRLSRFQV